MIGQFHAVIEACTINDITSHLKVVNWEVVNRNWDHLGEVNFPQVNRIKIDMLIGVDYPAFQFSFKRVPGIFYQIFFFFFHQMIALQKLKKSFFNSSKKLFSSSFSRYSNFS